jgi:hypothetical protein
VLHPHEEAGSPFRDPRPTLARIGEVDIGIPSAIVELRTERPRDRDGYRHIRPGSVSRS